MKKLQIFIIIFIFLLPSIGFVKLYSLKQFSDMIIDMSEATTLSINGGISKKAEKTLNNNKDLINAILDISKKYNVDFTYCGYETELSTFDESKTTNYKRTVFTTFTNSHSFKLKSGRSLNSSDEAEKFLSSENTGKKDQVGVLDWMSLGDVAEIRPWDAFENTCFWLHSMIVHTKDSKLLHNIISDFKNTYGISFQKAVQNKQYLYSNHVTTQEYKDLCYKTIMIIILLYMIMLIHNIFFNYKKFAIMKLNGVSNGKILQDLVCDAIKIVLTGLTTAFVIIFAYLICKRENDILGFLKVWIYKASLLSLILVFINVLLLFLIIKVKIPIALKNKKPLKLVQNINYIAKVIFATVLVSYLASSVIQLSILINSINGFKIWQEKAVNLVEPFGAIFGDNEEGTWWSESTMTSMKKLYDKLDKEGKVIYADLGHCKQDSIKANVKYAKLAGKKETPYMSCKSATVNNNYLKDNPIYDINNKRVLFDNNSENIMNLLVSDDLKKYETEIIKEYSKDNKMKDKQIKITYIKKGQKFFTYNLNVGKDKNNILTNIPVVIVCNRSSLDLDFYCCNGLKLIKVKDVKNGYHELLPYLKEVNLDNMIYNVRPVMWHINFKIYFMEQSLMCNFFKLFFAAIALILTIISSSINYIEKNKLKNTVLKIHGFSFIKRYAVFYILLILIWMLSYVASYEHYKSIISMKIVIISGLLDLIISTIILKVYENKKISSVLKGE